MYFIMKTSDRKPGDLYQFSGLHGSIACVAQSPKLSHNLHLMGIVGSKCQFQLVLQGLMTSGGPVSRQGVICLSENINPCGLG